MTLYFRGSSLLNQTPPVPPPGKIFAPLPPVTGSTHLPSLSDYLTHPPTLLCITIFSPLRLYVLLAYYLHLYKQITCRLIIIIMTCLLYALFKLAVKIDVHLFSTIFKLIYHQFV